MSVHVMSWVLRNSEARLGQRLVLLVLADHARDDGTSAWPSVGTMAREARMSESQTRTCLRQLEKSGSIAPTGKSKSGTVVYSVLMGAPKSGGAEIHVAPPPESGPEPSLEQPSNTSLQNGQRARNEIWDTLTHMFGEPATPSATRARGKVCAELKSAAATRDEILKRGRNWPSHFDQATLTEHALVKHWHTLGRKPLRAGGR